MRTGAGLAWLLVAAPRAQEPSLETLLVAAWGLPGNASGALINRGPDVVYDTALDITWTRQAGDGALREWADAGAWADALVVGES